MDESTKKPSLNIEGIPFADLNRVHVLDGMRIHALHGQRRFVFITSEGVKGLRELAERASDAGSYETFQKHFLTQDLSGEFELFARYFNTESDY